MSGKTKRGLLSDYREDSQSATRPLAMPETLHSEPWATVSQFARRLGHELRNSLGAIRNTSYFVNMALKGQNGDVRTALNILNREVDNANRLVTELLTFACPQPPQPHRLPVNPLVTQVLDTYLTPAGIQIMQDLAPQLPLVHVDGEQIKECLTRLVDNAVQAVGGAGRVTLTTSVQEDTVQIAVSDTGAGIPPEDLEKIFQPLYTTKAKGMGLGLATSRRLLAQNGGTLKVTSRLGFGTTFLIILPVMAEPVDI